MRKSLILAWLLVLMLVVAGPAFAKGRSGMRFGFEFGNPSIVGIFRLSVIDFRVGYDFTGLANDAGGNFLFLAADLRVVNNYPITDPINFFLCFGAFASIMMEDQGEGSNLIGLRIPVGVNLLLFRNAVEIFVEVVPTIGLFPALAFNSGGLQGWVGFTFALP